MAPMADSTVTSTGICPFCHRQASPVTRLYAELRNDQTSTVDVVFWIVIGGIIQHVIDGAMDNDAWWMAVVSWVKGIL